jgi:type IV secretion system protein VirB1
VPTPALRSPVQALAYARRRVAAGGSIDLGITQLNSAHLGPMHLTVDEAFEPCTNIAMGMNVLQAAWGQSVRRWGMTRYALFRAFEAYNGGPGAWASHNAGLRARVEGYANTVWARAQQLPLTAPAAAGDSLALPRAIASHAAHGGRVRTSVPHGVHVVFEEGR